MDWIINEPSAEEKAIIQERAVGCKLELTEQESTVMQVEIYVSGEWKRGTGENTG